MDRGDLPNNFWIHVTVVMCHDVAHTAHLTKGNVRKGLFGFFIQMSSRLSNDFNPPDDRVLVLLVGAERHFSGVLDIGDNQ